MVEFLLRVSGRKLALPLLLAAATVALFAACSDSGSSEPKFALHVENDGIFRGRLIKAWVDLRDGQWGRTDVAWRTGRGTVVQRTRLFEGDSTTGGRLLADTVWIEWNRLPPVLLDTLDNSADTTVTNVDTLFIDTLAVVVEDQESAPFVVEVRNILPQIDSVLVGEWRGSVVDSLVRLSAHPGQVVQFSFKLSDAYSEAASPAFTFPEGYEIRELFRSDTMMTFTWAAPDTLVNDTALLELRDTGGHGTRVYRLRFMTYSETGSVWVSTSTDLVKVASDGTEILRIADAFTQIAKLALDANREYLWVADRGAGSLTLVGASGGIRMVDSSSFNQPTTLAVDVQSGFLWIGDLATGNLGRLRRYELGTGDSLTLTATILGEVGPVTALSIDQYEADRAWYVAPEGDYLARITDGSRDTLYGSLGINRPEFLEWDAAASRLWMADSNALYLIDSTGAVRATVHGFTKVGGLSAGGGSACISDVRSGRVVRFPSTITGTHDIEDGQVTTGFASPQGTGIFLADGSCWVADTEAGSLVRLDSHGTETNRLGGLDQPKALAVHQGVE